MLKNKKASGGLLGIGFLLVVVIAAFAAITGFDKVEPSHKGVMVQLGELKGTMNPGLKWTGFFTETHQYDLKIRKMVVDMNQAGSAVDKDGQSVYATIEVNYRLSGEHVEDAFVNVGYDKDLENILNVDGIIREGFKTTTAKYTSKEIWQERNAVKAAAIEQIKANFPNDYFVLENVVISNINFNPQFVKAIEDKKTNEERALAEIEAIKIAEAQADRAIEVARGVAESAKLAAEAEAYQIEVKAAAEAKALELKSQELTPLMVQNNWIDAWATGGSQVPQYVLGGNDMSMLMTMPGQKVE